MDTVDRVRSLLEPIFEDGEVELYDLTFSGGVLKVTVDRVGGIDIGTVGSLTRRVSLMLDEADPIGSAFTLEVSSPGLERTLRTPAHYSRSVGEKVSVKTRSGTDGDRRIAGTLVAADDDGITVEPTGAGPDARRHLTYDQIDKARTTFEWGPTPKPGGPKAARTPSTQKKAARS